MTDDKTIRHTTTACAVGLHRVCPGTVTTQDPKTLVIRPAGTCSCLCHAARRNDAENA